MASKAKSPAPKPQAPAPKDEPQVRVDGADPEDAEIDSEVETETETEKDAEAAAAAPAPQAPQFPAKAAAPKKGKAVSPATSAPERQRVRDALNAQPQVQFAVRPLPKNSKSSKTTILAEINGIAVYAEHGKVVTVPAEVARIAEEAGLGQIIGELPKEFTRGRREFYGETPRLAEHPDPEFQDPDKGKG